MRKKSIAQCECEQLQRDRNLVRYRAEQRESDLYCGDGVTRGRVFSNHGFRKQPELLGPVATSDLDMETDDKNTG